MDPTTDVSALRRVLAALPRAVGGAAKAYLRWFWRQDVLAQFVISLLTVPILALGLAELHVTGNTREQVVAVVAGVLVATMVVSALFGGRRRP